MLWGKLMDSLLLMDTLVQAGRLLRATTCKWTRRLADAGGSGVEGTSSILGAGSMGLPRDRGSLAAARATRLERQLFPKMNASWSLITWRQISQIRLSQELAR